MVAAGDQECLPTPSDADRVQPSEQHAPWSSPPRSTALSPGQPRVEAGRARVREAASELPSQPAKASFPGSPRGRLRLPSPFLKPMPLLHAGRAPSPRQTDSTGSLQLSSSGSSGLVAHNLATAETAYSFLGAGRLSDLALKGLNPAAKET